MQASNAFALQLVCLWASSLGTVQSRQKRPRCGVVCCCRWEAPAEPTSGVRSERPLLLEGGVLTRLFRTCTMSDRWAPAMDRLNLRAKGKGDYTVWGMPVYHSRARNKLILTVILLLDSSEAPPSTECFAVSGLQIILPQRVLMKVLWWMLKLPQYSINAPDSEVTYTGD